MEDKIKIHCACCRTHIVKLVAEIDGIDLPVQFSETGRTLREALIDYLSCEARALCARGYLNIKELQE